MMKEYTKPYIEEEEIEIEDVIAASGEADWMTEQESDPFGSNLS